MDQPRVADHDREVPGEAMSLSMVGGHGNGPARTRERRRADSDLEDDLADHLTGFDGPMGLSGLFEREDPGHVDLDRTRGYEVDALAP